MSEIRDAFWWSMVRSDFVVLRNYDPKHHSQGVFVETGDETLTQQHLREEVDINTIVRRFGITGVMPSGVPGGVYGDFTGVEDYESAVAAVERAEAGFLTLPAEVRERFGNNPGMLIQYANGVPIEQLDAELRGMQAPVAPVAPVVPAPGDEAAVTP